MDQFAILCFTVVNSIAILALISLGLAVIFGMMRVINFAHGEFIMLGGYATVIATHAGMNLWLSMLAVAPVVVGLIGFAPERLIIRRLYGHLVTTMLATWGLSLFLIGAVTAIFGNTTMGVSAPLGNVQVGAYSIGASQLFLIAITTVLVGCSLFTLYRTKYGLLARAAMETPKWRRLSGSTAAACMPPHSSSVPH